jgi:HlyD family secretion protein
MTMLRFLLNWRLLAVVLIVGSILVVSLQPETYDVDLAYVSRGDLLVTVDEEGETRVRRRFVVASPVAGRVERIELEPGDRVARGRVVARVMPGAPTLLDPRTRAEFGAAVEAAEAALGQARAEYQRATAVLERARSLARRQEELAEAGAISRDEFEANVAALKVAEEERSASQYAVERGEHELRLAQARLAQPSAGGRTADVTAPIDGVVLKRFRESEADVPAGEPLLEIGDAGDLEIVSDLLSTDAVRVSPGDRVLIEQWGGTTPLAGRVRRIEPSGFMKVSALGVEEQRVNVIIDFDSSEGSPRALGDGYRVEVRVVVSELNDTLLVPIGALFRNGEAWAVFTIEDEHARLRDVQIGQRNELYAQIVGGLADGDSVIMHPPDVLTDGVRVRHSE